MEHVLDFLSCTFIYVSSKHADEKQVPQGKKSFSPFTVISYIYCMNYSHGFTTYIYTVIQMKINFNYWNVFKRFRYCAAVGRINFLIADLLDSHLIKFSTLLLVLSDKARGLRKFLAENNEGKRLKLEFMY